MKNKMICLFILGFAQIAGAGIRVINNGGGMAEMQALTALANIKSHFMPCLYREGFCTEVQRNAIETLDQEGSFNTAFAELEFFVPHSDQPSAIYQFRAENENYLSVASPSLYWPSNQAKSYDDIFKAIVKGWLLRPTVDASAAKVALEWANEWQSRVVSSFSVGDERRLLAIDSISALTSQKILTVVEQSKESAEDLTSLISAQLQCSTGPSELVSFSPKSIENNFILGKLTWQCGPMLKEASFAMSLPSQQKNPEGIRIILSQVQLLEGCFNFLGLK